MLATILRRWRLSAPLALISMVSILVGAMALAPASAHGDKPVTFSGFAAGVLGHVETPFTITSADFQGCFTGKVSHHGSSDLRVAAGEPLIFDVFVQQSGSDSQHKIVNASKCGTEVKSKKTGDGTGNVTATAILLGTGGDVGSIIVFDLSKPPFTSELIIIPGSTAPNSFAELATTASAFCNKEGTAKWSAAFADNSATGGFTANGHFNDFLGIFNQPVVFGPGAGGYTATLNELSASKSGDHASVTLIGLHITGNGVNVALAVSHANISCPK